MEAAAEVIAAKIVHTRCVGLEIVPQEGLNRPIYDGEIEISAAPAVALDSSRRAEISFVSVGRSVLILTWIMAVGDDATSKKSK